MHMRPQNPRPCAQITVTNDGSYRRLAYLHSTPWGSSHPPQPGDLAIPIGNARSRVQPRVNRLPNNSIEPTRPARVSHFMRY